MWLAGLVEAAMSQAEGMQTKPGHFSSGSSVLCRKRCRIAPRWPGSCEDGCAESAAEPMGDRSFALPLAGATSPAELPVTPALKSRKAVVSLLLSARALPYSQSAFFHPWECGERSRSASFRPLEGWQLFLAACWWVR